MATKLTKEIVNGVDTSILPVEVLTELDISQSLRTTPPVFVKGTVTHDVECPSHFGTISVIFPFALSEIPDLSFTPLRPDIDINVISTSVFGFSFTYFTKALDEELRATNTPFVFAHYFAKTYPLAHVQDAFGTVPVTVPSDPGTPNPS